MYKALMILSLTTCLLHADQPAWRQMSHTYSSSLVQTGDGQYALRKQEANESMEGKGNQVAVNTTARSHKEHGTVAEKQPKSAYAWQKREGQEVKSQADLQIQGQKVTGLTKRTSRAYTQTKGQEPLWQRSEQSGNVNIDARPLRDTALPSQW